MKEYNTEGDYIIYRFEIMNEDKWWTLNIDYFRKIIIKNSSSVFRFDTILTTNTFSCLTNTVYQFCRMRFKIFNLVGTNWLKY